MNPDQDDSAKTEDKGPSEATSDPTEPDARGKKTKSKTSGWWRRRRADQETQPTVSRCMVIGPVAAGKTQLLTSLQRCIDAKSHSYAKRYTASFGIKNDAFRDLDDSLADAYSRGLKLESTQTGDCFLPEFDLHLTAHAGRGSSSRYDTRFLTFEGSGGLLIKRSHSEARLDLGYQECRKMLEDALNKCETVLICLPIVGWVDSQQEQELNQFFHEFLENRRIHSLVVCLTMYEKLGVRYGRNAYQRLATRTAAWEAMRHAFDNHLSAVGNALDQFSRRGSSLRKRHRRRVWCTPVSSYGFVPHNGGANLIHIRYTQGNRSLQDELLRTIPTPIDSRFREHIPERPYSQEQAYRTYWRPFLTIDPFAFVATGDPTGTLIHSYEELRR
ncbi:MAG: hypothetical protein LGR52_15070 [Candidatus Thiosymbion ectosymbiont of Robbea hypermnestra]|nr:hypothetical protein [Candidatus Thiosymbion ectosymbiont of Robbea hypermnestra]